MQLTTRARIDCLLKIFQKSLIPVRRLTENARETRVKVFPVGDSRIKEFGFENFRG
jgi:hypothetical protein